MALTGKKGVDVSYANGDVDMQKIKNAGYDFVMIRCGYGSDIKEQDDWQFENNVKKCEKLGIPWGGYLYSYAVNQSEAKSEVEHIKRLLKGKKPTLPVALDVEDAAHYQKNGVYSKAALSPIISTIIKGIDLAGYYPMLYTGKYWLDGYDGVSGFIDKSVWSKVDIWLASWTQSCTYGGSNLGLWQYGGETNLIESNSIPGVGVIDKDKCYKDYPSIIKNGGYNGWTKPSTEKTLDKSGYKRGDETIGVLAMKELLIIARQKKIITQHVDENGIFGDGTEKAVNQVLKLGGYKQNGIAGKNFIKHLAKLIKEKI